MKNCIVAQSGGPTSVINASVIGVFDQNKESKTYDKVYFGINGIQGILQSKIVDADKIDFSEIEKLKFSPSSGLGSCRYKLCDYKKDDTDYKKLFKIFSDKKIEVFFYIGGNDSMDTVKKLSEYANENNVNVKIIGIPKTIDNDLVNIDHTPGFGSAAKLISTIVLETYLDSSIYLNNGIFILETMGRDTGWLAASACMARLNGEGVADLIYLPEVKFDKIKFLEDVKRIYDKKNKVYIVVSEGIGVLDDIKSTQDVFGHIQLGGVSNILKNMILNSGITEKVKNLELGVIQRSAIHCGSKTDIDEAYEVGRKAVSYSYTNTLGKMVSIKRVSSIPYKVEFELVDVSSVANKVKYFPAKWINRDKNGIEKEAIKYFEPLIAGNIEYNRSNIAPDYTALFL